MADAIIITRSEYFRGHRALHPWGWLYTVSGGAQYDASGTASEVRRIAANRAKATGLPVIDRTKGVKP